MKSTYRLTLTTLLIACGTSSSPSNQPTNQDCRNNRIWDEQQQECIEPESDATLEDAIAPDAGYIQKYEGKLYGMYQPDNINSNLPSYLVTFNFKTGKLEQLISEDGNIISLPVGSHGASNMAFSPDSSYLLSSINFGEGEPNKVYLFNVQNGTATPIARDIFLAQFAWKDNSTYFMSFTEETAEDENGNTFKTRIYQQTINDTSFSNWITEDVGKFTMPLAWNEIAGDIAFLCLAQGQDPTVPYPQKEVCTTPNRPNQSFIRNSRDLHPEISFSHTTTLFWPNIVGPSTVYLPCTQGEQKNMLCSFKLYDRSAVKVLAEVDAPFIASVVFNPSFEFMITNSKTMSNLTNSTNEGPFIPSNIQFEGQPLSGNYSFAWYAWREE